MSCWMTMPMKMRQVQRITITTNGEAGTDRAAYTSHVIRSSKQRSLKDEKIEMTLTCKRWNSDIRCTSEESNERHEKIGSRSSTNLAPQCSMMPLSLKWISDKNEQIKPRWLLAIIGFLPVHKGCSVEAWTINNRRIEDDCGVKTLKLAVKVTR